MNLPKRILLVDSLYLCLKKRVLRCAEAIGAGWAVTAKSSGRKGVRINYGPDTAKDDKVSSTGF